jgi:hypothetical protein
MAACSTHISLGRNSSHRYSNPAGGILDEGGFDYISRSAYIADKRPQLSLRFPPARLN